MAALQVPSDLPDFTDRSELAQAIERVLARGEHAVISASGEKAGAGKSALAVHVAHRMRAQYPEGQIMIDLGATSERPLGPTQAMARVVYHLDPEKPPPAEADAAEAYRAILARKRILLVFDNAAEWSQVKPLLPLAGCAAMVTSRRNIVGPGLRAFTVEPLSEFDSCELLQKIVTRERAADDERATEGELDEIAGLCGRLPLALRVAGCFLASYAASSVGEYIDALGEELERLSWLSQQDVEVEATLGLSAARLAREDRALALGWQWLTVFPGSFDTRAVERVWGISEQGTRDGLRQLIQRALVLYDGNSDRYRMHDMMRRVGRNAFEYGGGEPASDAETFQLQQAAAEHAAHYKDVLQTAERMYLQGGDWFHQGLELLDLEWDNIHTGLNWATRHACTDEDAARLAREYRSAGPHLIALRAAA